MNEKNKQNTIAKAQSTNIIGISFLLTNQREREREKNDGLKLELAKMITI